MVPDHHKTTIDFSIYYGSLFLLVSMLGVLCRGLGTWTDRVISVLCNQIKTVPKREIFSGRVNASTRSRTATAYPRVTVASLLK